MSHVDVAVSRLATDLRARRHVSWHSSNSGSLAAVVEGRLFPDRLRASLHHVNLGRFAYDATRCLLPEIIGPTGSLQIRDVNTGALVREWSRRFADSSRWRADDRMIAGVLWEDARAFPWAASLACDSDTLQVFRSTPMSHSLLGFRGGPARPVDWTEDGRLLATTKPAHDSEPLDKFFDTSDSRWHPAFVADLFHAATSDVITFFPGSCDSQVIARGCVTTLLLSPGRRYVLIGSAADETELAELLESDNLPQRIYDTVSGGLVRDLGGMKRGSVRWVPGRSGSLIVAQEGGEATQFQQISLHTPGHDVIGEVRESVRLWSPISTGSVVAVTSRHPAHARVVTPERTQHSELNLGAWIKGLGHSSGTGPGHVTASVLDKDGKRSERLLAWQERELVELDPPLPGWERHLVRPPSTRASLVRTGRLKGGAQYQIRRSLGASTTAPLPAVIWLNPINRSPSLPTTAQSGEEFVTESSGPPSPEWTFLPDHVVVSLACPIEWGGTAPFDLVRDQLCAHVTALLEELVTIDGIDTGNLVLGGHSFGAAAAAVVLTQMSTEFRCAILRSGAYNRTLTPDGFHDEPRTLWQARDIYQGFTLAYAAPEIRTPILLLQGTADPNVSTTVTQARAFYQALRAAGRSVRLALIHNEGHVFNTYHGIVTAAREELRWLDQWISYPHRKEQE